MASAFSSRLAVGSRKLSSVAVINQCIQSFVNFKNNVSAFAAIAAVRPKLEQWADPITDIDASVCDTVRRLRANPYLPSSLTIYGMVIHPHTGEIRVVDDGEGQEQEVL